MLRSREACLSVLACTRRVPSLSFRIFSGSPMTVTTPLFMAKGDILEMAWSSTPLTTTNRGQEGRRPGVNQSAESRRGELRARVLFLELAILWVEGKIGYGM
jgi:hypothetical protein